MKIAIDQIRLDEETRIRKDVGNISSLAESIDAVGLINPILIDEEMKLLAGFRRLTACKNLGWKDIEVRIVELNGDRLKMLDVEIAENFFRKDFTPEEILSTENRRKEILEELREKGMFERFWLWLKSLFSGTPSAAAADDKNQATDKIGTATIPAPEPDKPVAEHSLPGDTVPAEPADTEEPATPGVVPSKATVEPSEKTTQDPEK
jgi:ParB family chromosome partitioning protein